MLAWTVHQPSGLSLRPSTVPPHPRSRAALRAGGDPHPVEAEAVRDPCSAIAAGRASVGQRLGRVRAGFTLSVNPGSPVDRDAADTIAYLILKKEGDPEDVG